MQADPLLPLLVTWLPVVLLGASGGWALWPALCRRLKGLRLTGLLHNLGPEVRQGMVFEDGLDGLAFIDHAVMTPDGVVVLDVLPMPGAVFGGEQSDEWSVVVGHRTGRFPNPLTRVRHKADAIRFNRPKLPVRGLVLFSGPCSFPKGRPAGVVIPADLASERPPTAVPATLKREWDGLLGLADANAVRFGPELALSRGPRRDLRQMAAVACLAAAALWPALAIGLLR